MYICVCIYTHTHTHTHTHVCIYIYIALALNQPVLSDWLLTHTHNTILSLNQPVLSAWLHWGSHSGQDFPADLDLSGTPRYVSSVAYVCVLCPHATASLASTSYSMICTHLASSYYSICYTSSVRMLLYDMYVLHILLYLLYI